MEINKTSESNHSKSNFGKVVKGMGTHTKVNQKAKELVESQRERLGPSATGGLFAFGPSEGFMNVGGACIGPFLFSSPVSPSNNPKPKEKESGKSIAESSRN